MPAILITAPVDDAALARARSLAPDRACVYNLDGDFPDEMWTDAVILYSSGELPDPARAPALRWVQLYSAGADNAISHPLFEGPALFTSASGSHAVPIAEHVMGMVLSWHCRFRYLEDLRRQRRWPPGEERERQFSTPDLWGMTIGIVGYGSIGRQVGRLATAFGMRVLALQRGADHRDRGYIFPGVGDPEGALPERYYAPAELHELLAASDVVVIAVPLTPGTRGMFDTAAFRAMRRHALLVNIARGAVCEEAAMLAALREGRVAGAALDVFAQEPLPASSPFWAMENVLISPHISGYSAGTSARAAEVWLENLRRYLAGEPLLNVVSKEHRY
jgi:phosphoglycerate dehydrogenase-like enzyme